MKKLIIHIKPYIQGSHNGIHKIKPVYGISKVTIINGKLTYIAEDQGQPVYIPRQWVVSRSLV